MKNCKVARECSVFGKFKMCTKFLSQNLKAIHQLRDLGIDGRMGTSAGSCQEGKKVRFFFLGEFFD